MILLRFFLCSSTQFRTFIQIGNRNDLYSSTSLTNSIDPLDVFWNRKLKTGVRTVVVVRIEAKDRRTTPSEARLADKVFGVNGDSWNLKSGFNQCSYGQLQFVPLTTNPIIGSDGVYTLKLPNTIVTGADEHDLEDIAPAQLEKTIFVHLTR